MAEPQISEKQPKNERGKGKGLAPTMSDGDRHSSTLGNLRNTAKILRQASSSFTSNLLTFLLLSLLLLSFRIFLEHGTHLLTSFIDRDPSLKALLSRVDLYADHRRPRSSDLTSLPSSLSRRHHRRRPFLHLTRVGTLDDDFFSGDGDDDRSLFGYNRKSPTNGSFAIFTRFDSIYGFSANIVDDGIRVSEVFRPGITFKADASSFDNDDETTSDQEDQRILGLESGNQDFERIVDLPFFAKGFELGRRDAAALFFFVSFLSAIYSWVILGFLVTYSWVLGTVFIAVANDLIGRFNLSIGMIWNGSRLGFKRLSGFILMRWAVRDAITQLIGLWYFSEIDDQYSFFKLFVRLKLMPFYVMSPWIRGFEKEITGFLFTWVLSDSLIDFIFSVGAFVAIVDPRRSGREVMKEGCNLLLTMFNQAFQMKCLETIFCGSLMRLVLARICGKHVALAFQSVVEVYFMVAWLVFYFAARHRDAEFHGRSFGLRELEGLVEGLR